MKSRSTVSKAPAPARFRAGARLQNRLERGLDCWNVQFDGRSAVVRHSRGMLLLAQLLARPNSGLIHALQLAAWSDPAPIAGAVLELPDPDGSTPALVTASASLNQRSIQRDDLESWRYLRRKIYELQSIIDAPGESEVVKAEAEEELAALREAQQHLLRTKADAPRLSVRAVRRALWRAIKAMAKAVDHRGKPIPVLRDLAQHLDLYLVAPSSRYRGLRAQVARAEFAGCFQYTPPKGVRWTIH